jgi:hypothetical protein
MIGNGRNRPKVHKNKQRRLYEIIFKFLMYSASGDILHYCKENIVRLSVYLERPYVTKYETDQVTLFPLQMHWDVQFCALCMQVTSLHYVQTQMTKSYMHKYSSVEIIVIQFLKKIS